MKASSKQSSMQHTRDQSNERFQKKVHSTKPTPSTQMHYADVEEGRQQMQNMRHAPQGEYYQQQRKHQNYVMSSSDQLMQHQDQQVMHTMDSTKQTKSKISTRLKNQSIDIHHNNHYLQKQQQQMYMQQPGAIMTHGGQVNILNQHAQIMNNGSQEFGGTNSQIMNRESFQKKKRRHNLSQSIQKRLDEQPSVDSTTGYVENNVGMVQKSMHNANFAGNQGTNDQISLDAAQGRKTQIRIKNKAEIIGQTDFKSLNDFYDRKQQLQYGGFNEGANSLTDSQRYYSVGQNANLTSTSTGSLKQSSKVKNKMSNFLLKQQNMNHTAAQPKERLQSTQILPKKSAKVSKTGSIVLPANNTVQIVPQLRHQVSQSKNASSSGQFPTNAGYATQSHHRMYSDDQNNLSNNLQKGFNSASNAALQSQQAQIVSIYQQNANLNQTATHSQGQLVTNYSSSTGKLKLSGNQTSNGRKVVPIGQQQQNGMDGQSSLRNSVQQFQDSGDFHSTQNRPTKGHTKNQMSASITRKIHQADTSRVNRLPLKGSDVEVQNSGIFIPVSEMAGGFTHGNEAHSQSMQVAMAPIQSNQIPQKKSSQKQASVNARFQQREQSLLNQYKPMNKSSKQTIAVLNHKNMTGENQNLLQKTQYQILNQKSASNKSQSHIRQASVQMNGNLANQSEMQGYSQKLTIQHRKNKSMMAAQHQNSQSHQKLQDGHQQLRLAQQNQQNLHMQNRMQAPANDNYKESQNLYQSLATNEFQGEPQQQSFDVPHQKMAQQKQNFVQSSHRKNKTTIIGISPHKLGALNINPASTGYHNVQVMKASDKNKSVQQIVSKKSLNNQTLSQKSLRSSSSQRKRISSMDQTPAALNNQYRQQQEVHVKNYDQQQFAGNHRGTVSPDIAAQQAAFERKSQAHQMKAQKILKNQTMVHGGGASQQQRLKPQGNIVIQQEPAQGPRDAVEANGSDKYHVQKLNRRQQSLLKGDLQHQDMILIGHEPQSAVIQQHTQQGITTHKQDTNMQSGGVQDSHLRKSHQNQPMMANKQMQYQQHGSHHRVASGGKMRMDSANLLSREGTLQKGGQKSKHNRDRSIDSNLGFENIEVLPQAATEPNQKYLKKKKQQQEDPMRKSINITEEALRIGKIAIEDIAKNHHNRMYHERPELISPRTKEILELSTYIEKSFLQQGQPPKTTSYFYRAGKMLGRGAFGKVTLGMHKLCRKLVALKSINKEFMTDEKQKSKVMHEVNILLRLRHRSVVQLYETFETKRHMILAMELCAGGDLLNYVRKRKKLDETEAKVIFRQIIQGLGYIHKKRILHRDIKLDNILLDGKGHVKIADFGVSKHVKTNDVMHEQSGTPAYIAPEILKEKGYTGFQADIWSAGVVLYAMLFGTVPFKASNMKELHKMIIKGKYNLKEEISPEAKHLMRSMMETDPDKRITINKILSHPWITSASTDIDIFNEEEKEVVKKEFMYNNPKVNNRSEKINVDEEPWDCFTELNLDSINQTLRNESEKSVILAPFNSSISDFDEEEYKGMAGELIIERLFDGETALEDKRELIRFAARCRDQDRQYEINNNGELDNGVYHKFVYSSRDNAAKDESSAHESSINDLRPHSSRNLNRSVGGNDFGMNSNKYTGHRTHEDGDDVELTASLGEGDPDVIAQLDEERIKCLCRLGYPEDYIRFALSNNEASYCLSAYFLLGEDQQY